MSDMGEFWKDVKQQQQVIRSDRRENALDALRDEGIAFEIKNGGAHLIVTGPKGLIDFWPGTGKWKDRTELTYSHGLPALLKHCGKVDRPGLGIFCTAARTELVEKCPEVTPEILRFINRVAEAAYDLGRVSK